MVEQLHVYIRPSTDLCCTMGSTISVHICKSIVDTNFDRPKVWGQDISKVIRNVLFIINFERKNIQYYKLNIEYIMCKKRDMNNADTWLPSIVMLKYTLFIGIQSIKIYGWPETD
jgi:hypothetical protein